MRILPLVFTILFLFIGVRPVFAATVVINEIMANPSTGEKEWVELINTSSSEVNLDQWTIKEKTSSGNINSHSLPSVLFPASSLCYFEFSGSSLNNDGDTVSLDDQNGEIDSYTYTSTTQSKTFSRVPDGGNWQTNIDATKSSIICSSLSTASPTPTPTTTPTPTATSTSSFTISDVPSQINSNQSFSVKVTLSIPNNPSTIYYLKGAFKLADGTRYFGLTKNSDWVEYGDEYSDQYKITTDSTGNWNGNLEVKPDINDKDFKGSGDYTFKVGRLTSSGSGPTWSNESNLKINSSSTPQPTIQNNPIPTKSATPAPTATSPSKTLSPSPSNLSKDNEIATVAGIKTEDKSSKGINLFSITGIMMMVAGVTILSYIVLKNKGINLWQR